MLHPSDGASLGRVLVAEADAEVRRAMRARLEDAGATVTEAATGEEADALLAERGPFDAIVSEVRMPPPTGLRLLATLRSAGDETPVVLIAGSGDDDLPATVAQFRHTVLLVEPFRLQEVVEAVRRAIGAPVPMGSSR